MRWVTGEGAIEQLDQADFWDLWWQQASQAAKLAYIASVCWRCQDEDDLPFIVAIDRNEGATRTLMYKPCGALTAEDYAEVKAYFLALSRYESRAADIVDGLAVRFEGKGVLWGRGDDAGS